MKMQVEREDDGIFDPGVLSRLDSHHSDREEKMREVWEAYRRIGDPNDRFNIDFWQSQGERAIFEAALEMISDYLILRCGHADQPRLQRTVESFGKA